MTLYYNTLFDFANTISDTTLSGVSFSVKGELLQVVNIYR